MGGTIFSGAGSADIVGTMGIMGGGCIMTVGCIISGGIRGGKRYVGRSLELDADRLRERRRVVMVMGCGGRGGDARRGERLLLRETTGRGLVNV
jgi:hypothetical protein